MAAQQQVATGRLRRLAGQGFWTVIAYATTAGSAFVVSVMLGRALGPTTFGEFSFALWLLRTVPGLLALGVPAALAKMAAERLGSDQPEVARGFLRLSLGVHTGMVGAAAIVAAGVMIARPDRAWFTLLVLAGIGITLALLDLEALLTAAARFRTLSLFAALSGLAQVVVTAIGIVVGIPWEGFLVLFVATAAIGLVAMASSARRTVPADRRAPLPRPDRSSFLRFAGVSTFALVVDQVVWGRPELFFLELFTTADDVGFYAAALRLASLAAVLPLVAAKPLLPEFSRMRGAEAHEELVHLFPSVCAPLLGIAAPIAAIGAAVSGPAVVLFYGEAFAGAAAVTALLIGGSVVRALTAPLSAALLTGPRPRFVAELGVVAVAATLVLDVVAISVWGLFGAAVANLAGQLVWLCGAATYAWQRLGLRYPVRVVPPVAVLSIASGLGAWLITDAVDGMTGLVAGTTIAALGYLLAAGTLGMLPISELRSLVRRRTNVTTP